MCRRSGGGGGFLPTFGAFSRHSKLSLWTYYVCAPLLHKIDTQQIRLWTEEAAQGVVDELINIFFYSSFENIPIFVPIHTTTRRLFPIKIMC